jgi:hypothetical protein
MAGGSFSAILMINSLTFQRWRFKSGVLSFDGNQARSYTY